MKKNILYLISGILIGIAIISLYQLLTPKDIITQVESSLLDKSFTKSLNELSPEEAIEWIEEVNQSNSFYAYYSEGLSSLGSKIQEIALLDATCQIYDLKNKGHLMGKYIPAQPGTPPIPAKHDALNYWIIDKAMLLKSMNQGLSPGYNGIVFYPSEKRGKYNEIYHSLVFGPATVTTDSTGHITSHTLPDPTTVKHYDFVNPCPDECSTAANRAITSRPDPCP